MTAVYIYFSCISFILGAVMASAMTCLGDRTAAGESWTQGRSHCDACGHELGLKDLIPVISYLAGHGRCRYCGAKLSKKYLVTEIFTGVIFVLLFLKQGEINPTLVMDWGAVCVLLALSITDMDCGLIPDRFNLALMFWWAGLTLVQGLIGGGLGQLFLHGVLGAVFCAGFVLIIVLIMDKMLGRETMGGGDIKLFFATGLYTGLAGGLLMVIASCVIGLIFMATSKKKQLPFGPSISLAVVFVMLCGDWIIHWYMGLLGL